MEQSKFNPIKMLSYAGAVISFYIGSGFASMQEIMQYNASYGSRHWIVVAVCAVIFIYTNLSFIMNGSIYKLEKGTDVYNIYCGKYIGKFFDFWSVLFCYMSFWVMCGGASSTATQQFGAPTGVGTIILVVAVVATVVFGLDGVVNALGVLGPIIIICVLFTSFFVCFRDMANLADGLALIDSGTLDLVQVGGGNPAASGASYAGFVVLWFAAFLAEIGAKNKVKEVTTGMLLGSVLIFTATVACTMALGVFVIAWGPLWAYVPATITHSEDAMSWYTLYTEDDITNVSDDILISNLVYQGTFGGTKRYYAAEWDKAYSFCAVAADANGTYGPVFRKTVTFTKSGVSPVSDLQLTAAPTAKAAPMIRLSSVGKFGVKTR